MRLHGGPLVLALALPLASLTVLAAPVVARPAPAPDQGASSAARAVAPDPSDRETMRRSYLRVLRPALRTPLDWQGDLRSCRAGRPSDRAQTATLRSINWFRTAVGVTPVTFSARLSARAQRAALIMARNGALSHSPPPSWACRTKAGAAAAGRSNLYLGRAGASAVAGYLDDPGAGNTAVGHRRWIIDPRQTTMGSGSVQPRNGDWQKTSNVLYVLDTASFRDAPAGTPEFLPWPTAGFVPVQVEPEGRWSLSASNTATDFSDARVTVDGSAAGITQQQVATGYGPPTLVWDFDPGFDPGDPDRDYDVSVTGIRQGSRTVSYAYTVTLFDAEQ